MQLEEYIHMLNMYVYLVSQLPISVHLLLKSYMQPHARNLNREKTTSLIWLWNSTSEFSSWAGLTQRQSLDMYE